MSVVSRELTWDTPRPPLDQGVTAFTNTAPHLQSRRRLSLHATLWIMETMWGRSMRRSGVLMEVTGLPSREQLGESTTVAQESPEGLIYISHSRLERRRLTSIPVDTVAIHIRYAFNFSFGDYGEPDLRDSVTNFPRLSDVERTCPFHGVKMTALQIFLSWLQGKPQMLWKCCFIKSNLASFLSLWGIHKNLCTLLENYFWQMNNGARWKLKGQMNWKELKWYFCPHFLSTCGENDNEKLFHKKKTIFIMLTFHFHCKDTSNCISLSGKTS